MMADVVVDTNVAIVANGRTEQAGIECEEACIDALERIYNAHRVTADNDENDQCRVVLDDDDNIMNEYRRHLSPSGQPGPGDAFFKWLWDNQFQEDHCARVRILPDAERGYHEFPDDGELAGFDLADRKFVAVARAAGTDPPILNASDTDWWHDREALARNGVRVEFLCPELMRDR